MNEIDQSQIADHALRTMLDIALRYELDSATYMPALHEAFQAGVEAMQDEVERIVNNLIEKGF